MEEEFPNAKIIPSTYDQWFPYLNQVRDNLQVIENEIGDTWIHGCPSDPLKLSSFRAIQRERSACLLDGDCSLDDPLFFNFSRTFIKLAEHTWFVIPPLPFPPVYFIYIIISL